MPAAKLEITAERTHETTQAWPKNASAPAKDSVEVSANVTGEAAVYRSAPVRAYEIYAALIFLFYKMHKCGYFTIFIQHNLIEKINLDSIDLLKHN